MISGARRRVVTFTGSSTTEPCVSRASILIRACAASAPMLGWSDFKDFPSLSESTIGVVYAVQM